MNAGKYEKILSRLEKVRWFESSRVWRACCPAHNDKNPSLLLWIGKTGNLIAKCKSKDCPWIEIVSALNTQKSDWFPEENVDQVKSKCVARYHYQDADGVEVYSCSRFEPGRSGKGKDFCYSRKQPGGVGWINNIDGVKRVIYRLPEVLDPSKRSHPVFVVEGEKCVEEMRKLGFVATCNPCGAGNWSLDFGKWLADRRVVVLPDNDEPGWRHAVSVVGSLIVNQASEIWIIHLPNLPESGDVADWLKAFPEGTSNADKKKALIELIKSAKKWVCV